MFYDYSKHLVLLKCRFDICRVNLSKSVNDLKAIIIQRSMNKCYVTLISICLFRLKVSAIIFQLI